MAHKAMDPAAELYDYLIVKTGTLNMKHGQSSKRNASTSGVMHGIYTGGVGKSAPETKLYLPGNMNEKFVRKLVFLHNNLMQYYMIPYEEVMIVYDPANLVVTNSTTLIYYKPTIEIVKTINEPYHLYQIYTTLEDYLATGWLQRLDMEYANTVWQWLKEKAGITTP